MSKDRDYRKNRKSEIVDIIGFQTLSYKKTSEVYKLGHSGLFSVLCTCCVIEDDNKGYFTLSDIMRYVRINKSASWGQVDKLIKLGLVEELGRKSWLHAMRYKLTPLAHTAIKYYNRVMIRLIEERKADIWGNTDSIRYLDIKAAKQKKKKAAKGS